VKTVAIMDPRSRPRSLPVIDFAAVARVVT
jgi:hypothetical protein